MGSSTGQEQSKYAYDPSLAAAIVAAALYGTAFILTLVLWLRYKAWVWLVMVIAAAMEAVGYISRCFSIEHDTNKSIYTLQFSLLVLAPVLMAAAYYVVFGRIIFLVVPKEARTFRLLWVPPRFITPIFVGFDVVALLLQLVGAVIITSVDPTTSDASKKLNTGKHIAQAGVILQLLAFGLFTITAIRFNFTSKRFRDSTYEREPQNVEENSLQIEENKRPRNSHWPTLLHVVNLTSLCILVRSVFRLVQFSQGPQGYTSTHEWCMYVFDTLPIYPCVTLYLYWHPAKYLPHLGFRLPKHVR